MTASFLDNVVDRKVLQACILGEYFAVRRFAHTWGSSDDYIRLSPHNVGLVDVVLEEAEPFFKNCSVLSIRNRFVGMFRQNVIRLPKYMNAIWSKYVRSIKRFYF